MTNFGAALRFFRQERGLSLREVAKLGDVDHAYIHRLETGDKTDPSPDVLSSLAGVLKLSQHRRALLKSLHGIDAIPDSLFEAMLADPKRTTDAMRTVLVISYRGARPQTAEDWGTQLDRIDTDVLLNRVQ